MKKELNLQEFLDGLKAKDLSILAKAITLVESKKDSHKKLSSELIKAILPLTGKAKRIGISGTPGVGKSTFLENFGMFLINQNKSVAVLAVDPTSQITGGSILGDKTRMSKLSSHAKAFVRPTPNGPTLGGIAAKTREGMLLCDAFGFDYIFIETVGVGQSEISVRHIVDMFLLLMQPGSGDELQGIKRGILEVSDLVVVNKSDGDAETSAKIAQHDFKRSLEILQDKRNWKCPVTRCSSTLKKGFSEVDEYITQYFSQYDNRSRDVQIKIWMEELLKELFQSKLNSYENFDKIVDSIKAGKEQPLNAVETIFKDIFKND
jgi:LAO/AO transport system kinase